jgi:hypothetical protein
MVKSQVRHRAVLLNFGVEQLDSISYSPYHSMLTYQSTVEDFYPEIQTSEASKQRNN